MERAQSATLSAEEVAQYREQGYFGPFDLIERERALALGRRLASRRRGFIDRLRGRNPWEGSLPELTRVGSQGELLDRVEALLGPNLVLWRTRVFVKAPGERRYPFHQDGAFWRLLDTETSPPSEAWHLGLSAWIALDDTDLDNGCVEVIPGSHQRLVDHISDSWAYGKGIADGNVPGGQPVPMIMKAGQCFLFHYFAVHRSGVNTSGRTRTGFSVRFTVPGVVMEQASRDRSNPPVLVRGEYTRTHR